TLLTCGGARGIALREASTGRERRFVPGPSVYGLAFAPDGQTFASSGGGVRVWVTATGALRHTFPGGVAAFSPDGKLLAAADGDGGVRVWDPSSGREVQRLPGKRNHDIRHLFFTPDGKTLAVGGEIAWEQPFTVVLWDVATAEE